MDRRFFTFILASTAFFLVYASLRIMFVPPPLPQELAVKESGDVEPSVEDSLLAEKEPDQPTGDESSDASIERPDKPQWQTLGSMEANAGYMMLVTISNVGSGIERIELTERKENGRLKYRRVDVQSGYMGYIAADETATETGVRVNVVGPGTPIDLAECSDPSVKGGLQVDDLIVSLNDKPINNASEMVEQLEKSKPGQKITLGVDRNEKSLSFTVLLSEHPLDLVRLSGSGGMDEIPGNLSRLSCLMSLAQLGNRPLINDDAMLGDADPSTLLWDRIDADPSDDESDVQTAVYQLRLSNSELKRAGGKEMSFRRGYRLAAGSYLLDMDLELQNASDSPQSVAYRLEGVNGVTLEGWWYSNKISPKMFEGAAARDVVYRTPVAGHQLVSGYGLLKNARDVTKAGGQSLFVPASTEAERQLKYIGVDAQYFTVAYVPPAGTDSLSDFGRATATLAANADLIPKHKERAVNATFYLDSQKVELAPGETMSQSLRIFAGPKQPALLDTVGMGEVVYYGWFSWPAKLLGHLLHFLSGVGNYAIAIVLLTVIVRAAMFPLSRKAAINAQRMQELAPELKKIAEKYKDDMEGRIRAQRELQQRVGFNPMAGCLPMLLQLPIFMGLYRTLSVDIELRQAAFASWTTWSSNLAAPDMLAYWGDWMWDYMGGRGTGWLGPYFNILPMIVVVLFLIQQKMFMPPATDEQTMMQQKMMNYMTLFMGLFFFRVPAGLCIYFITSSIWGISERIVVKRTLPSKPHFDPLVLEGKSSPKGREGDQVAIAAQTNGKSSASGLTTPAASNSESWTDKLRKKIVNEEPAAPPPKDRKRPAVNKKRK